MAKREILVLPDPRLRQVADPIEKIDASIKQLAKDMLDTMYDAQADPIVMINPEILKYSEDTVTSEEGCLSIPEIYYEVERPADVTVRYTDLDGKTVEKEATDRLAVCIQHELDHLDGVLYIDYLSRLKRDRVLKKFQKAEKLAKKAS
jgi:peptide deformylase